MSRFIVGLLICGLGEFVSQGAAQEVSEKRLKELVSKFPTPAKKDGKLADVDKKATDAAVSEFLKDAKGSIIGLVKMLSPKDDNVQLQHAIHAIVIQAGDTKNKAVQQVIAQALAATLTKERSKKIQKFVVRQLQLIGTAKETAAIGKLLLDADVAEPAAQALLAIKTTAAEQFRAALPKVDAKQRALIVHGLGTLKDKNSAKQLRAVLADEDRDTRLTAAWALARIADEDSAKQLLKLADTAKGFERARLTDACLQLAKNLIAAGDKAAARGIYTSLQKSRTGKNESYVRDAAAKGLKITK